MKKLERILALLMTIAMLAASIGFAEEPAVQAVEVIEQLEPEAIDDPLPEQDPEPVPESELQPEAEPELEPEPAASAEPEAEPEEDVPAEPELVAPAEGESSGDEADESAPPVIVVVEEEAGADQLAMESAQSSCDHLDKEYTGEQREVCEYDPELSNAYDHYITKRTTYYAWHCDECGANGEEEFVDEDGSWERHEFEDDAECTPVDSDEHIRRCKLCDEEVQEIHTVDCANQRTCIYCHMNGVNSFFTKHSEEGNWQSDDFHHWRKCAKCGEIIESEMHRAYCDEAPVACSVCGKTNLPEECIQHIDPVELGEGDYTLDDYHIAEGNRIQHYVERIYYHKIHCNGCGRDGVEDYDWDYDIWEPHTYENFVCTKCGYETEPCGSPWDHYYEDGDGQYVNDKYHTYECMICHETISEDHMAFCTEPGVCVGCGEEIEGIPVDHDWIYEHYIPDDDGEGHHNKCRQCGAEGNYAEHYVRCDNPGVCDTCGAKTDQPASHEYDFDAGAEYVDDYLHSLRCIYCDELYYEWHEVACNSATPATCDICGHANVRAQKRHVSDLFDGPFTGHDEDNHWRECVGCGVRRYERHAASCTDPTGACAVCGAKTANVTHNIDYSAKSICSNETHHWYECKDCHAKVNVYEHIASCVTTGGSTGKKCADCGREMDKNAEVSHVYGGAPVYKDSKLHTWTCVRCGKTLTDAHYTVCTKPGECAGCGAKGNFGIDHDAMFIKNGSDEEFCWYYCTNCEEYAYKIEHVVTCYSDNTCTFCGRKIANPKKLQHEFVDGKCVFCEAVEEKPAVPVTKIALSKATLTVKKGETSKLTATVTPKNASNPALSWTSDNLQVATVEDGEVTAVGPGKAKITCEATDGSGKSASCTVTVPATKVTSVKLDATAISLEKGETETLTAAVLPENADNPALIWTTSNEGVATVEGGEITAAGPGKATITCKAQDGSGKSATCTVTVTDPNAEIEYPSELTLGKGETQTPVPVSEVKESFTYESEDKAIATVSAKGAIKGVSKGTTTITVTGKLSFARATLSVTVVDAPTSLTLNETARTLGMSETLELTATIPEGSASKLTASSSSAKIAKIEETAPGAYLVTPGSKTGTATITVKAFNGKKATCKVTVKKTPTDGTLSIAPAALTLAEGQAATLAAKFQNGYGGGYSWRVESGTGAAEIDENGALTAKSAGSVTVVAETYNGVTARCDVTIEPEPERVELNAPGEVTLGVGEALALIPVARDGSGAEVTAATPDTFTFEIASSGPEGVVTLDKKGKITAKKAGSATVEVKAYNDVTAEIHVTVKAAPTKVAILNNPKTLGVGEPWTLGYEISAVVKKETVDCAGAVTFKSSNKAVLDVDPQSGELKALKKGSAKITATTYNKKSASVTISVMLAPEEGALSINPAALTLAEKQTETLKAVYKKNYGGGCSWRVESGTGAAEIDENGALTAKSAGSVTVVAETYNGVTARCDVTIEPEPERVELNAPGEVTLGVGEALALIPVAKDGSGAEVTAATLNTFHFASAPEGFVTVDAKGKITAKKVSEEPVTVTAEAYNGVRAEVKVTVKNAPTKIAILNNPKTLGVGEPWTLNCEISAVVKKETVDCAGAVTFKSSSKGVLDVDPQTGKLTALKKGSAKITATTYNKKSASVTISVMLAPEEISLTQGKVALEEGALIGTYGAGESVKLSVAYAPSGSFGNVIWESSDDDIAAVENGTVTAGDAPGTATITARVYNQQDPGAQLTASCRIEVKAAPTAENAKLVPAKTKIGAGESVAAIVEFDGAAGAVKSYKTSIKQNATVSAAGVIKGVKKNTTAVITAVMYNGAEIPATVEIVAPPETLAIANPPEELKMKVGDTWKPEFDITGYGGDDFTGLVTTFTSSNKRAAVFEDGVLRAVGTGSTKITCKTYNGRASKTITIQVDAN